MQKQQKQPLKFVIHSKLEQLGGDESAAVEEIDNKPSAIAEDSPESNKASTSIPDNSVDNDKKRKRNERDAIPMATKKIHTHMKKWNEKQAELANVAESEDSNQEEFSDLSRMACLLCQRKFKSEKELRRHESLSELHKTNLGNQDCVEKARKKLILIATRASPEKQAEETEDNQSSYRNRAAERRMAFGQPDRPLPLDDEATSFSHRPPRQHKPAPGSRPVEAASVSNPMSESNVGARMLKSMGWKSGEGLGKEGTGIVAPVMAESYVKGAGLGTFGGRQDMEELGANTSYKDRAKYMARKRYENS
ncbi:hypothetical protein K450DRAFT_250252 [Umbelopsis ramanniana AG]|uniref:G-patch domain-containing protein n=1 Tax=Umbelopsis ramanniana AG TaxID=1314678 RepID=A0AAD5E6X9_UMBRA|nr:uncharacterized protein K450DRAFT_250252 [Umbelopsis ramanniana AG]KAI8577834.1 hypothetical protein K450DRAFT_250252 [Umbelopsis ramanniana AG]